MSVLLQISSGTGPVEVKAFVDRLADALQTELEARGVGVHGVDRAGDPPSSATLLVDATAAQVADLVGTHALVRPSASCGKKSRKRWFVGVSVWPVPDAVPALDPADLEVRADRAGGPGGQHVNTTASAVRMVHRPTGVSVRVASERSQVQNRKVALRRLEALLAGRARDEGERQARSRHRERHAVVRGDPVRTWTWSELNR